MNSDQTHSDQQFIGRAVASLRKGPGARAGKSSALDSMNLSGYRMLESLKGRVRGARVQAQRTVNTLAIELYWSLGKDIQKAGFLVFTSVHR